MLRTHAIANAPLEKEVTLGGWAHEIRNLGSLNFIILRDHSGLIQVTIKKKEASPELLAAVEGLVKETALLVTGTIKPSTVAGLGREIYPTQIEVLGRVEGQVPFELTGKVPAELDVRLDHRVVDLRRRETTAVFNVRHTAQKAFREKLYELDFQEINTPSIIASASEGGTDLFPVEYFEKRAYLAQSPQLYKQMAVMGGMDKVFMTMPIFRAEKHNTIYHLNEITQMDAEIGFATHDDAMNVLASVFMHITKRVSEQNKADLELLNSPVTPIQKIPRYTYDDMVEKLQKAGSPIKKGEDFTKEDEKKMGELTGDEAFIVWRYPTAVRAFYSMPDPQNGAYCLAYDLFYRGMEMASGAQRIHTPELLIKQLKARGLNPADFENYIAAFKYGAIPHAGWSIGSERLTMKLTSRENVREAALFPRDRHRLTP